MTTKKSICMDVVATVRLCTGGEQVGEGPCEQTLVVLKPDAVRRRLIGEILSRFEKAQLTVVAMKITRPGKETLDAHFSPTHYWLVGMGQKSLTEYKKHRLDPVIDFGTEDPYVMGKIMLAGLYEYYQSGPVVPIVLRGIGVVAKVRKMIGNTIPALAEPGTIRGDFSSADALWSNAIKSPTKNLIHASGTLEEARREIAAWFDPAEIVEYDAAEDGYSFGAGALLGWNKF